MQIRLFSAVILYCLLGVVSVAQADNSYCREFTRTIMIGGKPQEGYGIACRQPDGSWRIQKEDSLESGGDIVFSEPAVIEKEVIYVERDPVYIPPPRNIFSFSLGGEPYYRHHHHWRGHGHGRGHHRHGHPYRRQRW